VTDVAADRESPLVARNFQVTVAVLGPRGGRVGESDVACSEVVLPVFRLGSRPIRDDAERGAEPDHLVLRRGHTGSSTFFEWWRAERDSERDRVREVTVVLLDDAHEPVTAWKFTGCRIVSLGYSTLDALALEVVTESLELSFETVEQFSVGR
jgi:T4-like virus tail tube protein gp19